MDTAYDSVRQMDHVTCVIVAAVIIFILIVVFACAMSGKVRRDEDFRKLFRELQGLRISATSSSSSRPLFPSVQGFCSDRTNGGSGSGSSGKKSKKSKRPGSSLFGSSTSALRSSLSASERKV